jgi:TRAP-type uncharacterized transport system fused permease subunit
MFVFAPALLFIGSPGEIIQAVPTALIGVYALALGLQGWGLRSRLNPVQRAMALGAAVLMIFPGWLTDIPGVILLALLYLWERFSMRKKLQQSL